MRTDQTTTTNTKKQQLQHPKQKRKTFSPPKTWAKVLWAQKFISNDSRARVPPVNVVKNMACMTRAKPISFVSGNWFKIRPAPLYYPVPPHRLCVLSLQCATLSTSHVFNVTLAIFSAAVIILSHNTLANKYLPLYLPLYLLTHTLCAANEWVRNNAMLHIHTTLDCQSSVYTVEAGRAQEREVAVKLESGSAAEGTEAVMLNPLKMYVDFCVGTEKKNTLANKNFSSVYRNPRTLSWVNCLNWHFFFRVPGELYRGWVAYRERWTRQ